MSGERKLRYEFVVVGGGLAGVAAALAAARKGVRTALVQDRPVLGGNASSEIRVAPVGAGAYQGWARETGIIAEILDKERAANHCRLANGKVNSIFDFMLYDECRRQDDLDLHLNMSVDEVETGGGGVIASVCGTQLGTETRIRFLATLFADCTGDGSVAAKAGCEAMVADRLMGSTVLFAAVDTGRPAPYVPPQWAHRYPDEPSLALRHPTEFEAGYWWIEIGHPYDTIRDNEEIRDLLLAHVHGVWDHIKNRCTRPGVRERARTWALDWVGVVPGKRESRRIVGGHVLSLEELRNRTTHFDDVCHGGWYVDLHAEGGVLAAGAPNPVFSDLPEDRKAALVLRLYPIPYRCLFARDAGNLFIAGRCFSADREVFGSARVMGTTSVMGEVVGTAASVCARHSVRPAAIAERPDLIGELQQSLIDGDVFIPDLPDRNPANLARSARATASSVRPFNALEEPTESVSWPSPMGLVVPVTPGPVEGVDIWIEGPGTRSRVGVRIEELSDIWDNRPKAESEAAFRCSVDIAAGAGGWVRVPIGVDVRSPLLRLVLETDVPLSLGAVRPALPGFLRQKLDRSTWHSRFDREQDLRVPLRVFPEPRVFGPESAINGWSRPVRGPNLWMSDPMQPFPQWIELAWERPVSVGRVILFLDTNLLKEHRLREGFYRSPECARDFAIQVAEGGRDGRGAPGAAAVWRTVWRTSGNILRRHECIFPAILTDRVRVLVEATNGDPSARIYEVKVFDG